MTTWEIERGGTTEPSVFDVQYVDSENTFGDYLIAKIDDSSGDKFDQYPRGTRIDASVTPTPEPPQGIQLTVSSGQTVSTTSGTTDRYGTISNAGTYQNSGTVSALGGTDPTAISKFSGYVVERREIDQQGADVLEIEAYTFDQFLRRNTVSTNLSGKTISSALESIVKNDTPVSFDASKIQVGDDQELRRSYRGTKVEDALRDLAFKSEDEEFGVDSTLDFFFRPEEQTHIDRGIDDTTVFTYDLPERGKEAINEVEVWYNDGDDSVIVDDGQDKLDLQDSLNLQDPGTQRAELQRPDIGNVGDAEDEGRKYLQFRNATLTGEVRSFGLFEAEPGDTIDITISARGIDTEFRIAEVDYRWADDETILTVVEKRGDNDDVLLRLTDAVDRVEMRGADRDAPKSRITTTEATGLVEATSTVTIQLTQDTTAITSGSTQVISSGESEQAELWANSGTLQNAGTAIETGDEVETRQIATDRITNAARNTIRDAWVGQGTDPIDTLVFGDDNSGLSRSNTSLGNQTSSVSISPTASGSKEIDISQSVSVSASEIGLETSNGELVYRAVLDSTTSISNIDITLSISDSSGQRSVLTNTGQEAVRDILIANSPTLPQEYAYGTGDKITQEVDQFLDNEVTRQDFDDVLLETYDSTSEWADEFSVADDVPLEASFGEVTQLQTTQFSEAEDAVFVGNTVTSTAVSGALSNNEGIELVQENDLVRLEFTFDYRVPSGEWVGDIIFTDDNFDGTITLTINGNVESTRTVSGGSSENATTSTGSISQEIQPGEQQEFQVEVTNYNSGGIVIDTIQAVDLLDRFSNINADRLGTFDSTLQAFDAPELYPKQQEIEVGPITPTRQIDEGRVESTWDNLDASDGNQFISLSNDGSNFIQTTESDTATATFSSLTRELYVRFGLSNATVESTKTPTQGDSTTKLQSADVFANPSAVNPDGIGTTLSRVVIPSGTITGNTIQEAGIIDGNGDLLSRHVFAEFEVLANQQLISSETTGFAGPETL